MTLQAALKDSQRRQTAGVWRPGYVLLCDWQRMRMTQVIADEDNYGPVFEIEDLMALDWQPMSFPREFWNEQRHRYRPKHPV